MGLERKVKSARLDCEVSSVEQIVIKSGVLDSVVKLEVWD